jgi:hypothetical protein
MSLKELRIVRKEFQRSLRMLVRHQLQMLPLTSSCEDRVCQALCDDDRMFYSVRINTKLDKRIIQSVFLRIINTLATPDPPVQLTSKSD